MAAKKKRATKKKTEETEQSAPDLERPSGPPKTFETSDPGEESGDAGNDADAGAVVAGEGDGEAPRVGRNEFVEAAFYELIFGVVSRRDALRLAEAIADRMRLETKAAPSTAEGSRGFYDLRSEQDYDYPNGANKTRMRAPGVPVRRDLSDVDTICVHQTGVEFGVSQRAIDAADGDVELARARRALDVACHAMAFRQGYFVAAHDIDVYVNHGNRFNPTSLGLEIDGRYSGLEDDPATLPREDLDTTWGGEPTTLTQETIDASKEAIRWMVTETRNRGGEIKKLVSHRQSSDKRRSDPGESIWRQIVLPIAEELGLEVVTSSPWNQGRPVPLAWDPNGKGEY